MNNYKSNQLTTESINANEIFELSAAYILAGKRPMFPTKHGFDLTTMQADSLYEQGNIYGALDPRDAVLPVMEINLCRDEPGAEIDRIMQPKFVHFDDGKYPNFCTTFITCSDSVICHLGPNAFTPDPSYNDDIGVFRLTDRGCKGIDLQVISFNPETENTWKKSEIEDIIRWLYIMWRGIQYQLIHSPDYFIVRDYTLSDEEYDEYVKDWSDSYHIVKNPLLYIAKDESSSEEE